MNLRVESRGQLVMRWRSSQGGSCVRLIHVNLVRVDQRLDMAAILICVERRTRYGADLTAEFVKAMPNRQLKVILSTECPADAGALIFASSACIDGGELTARWTWPSRPSLDSAAR